MKYLVFCKKGKEAIGLIRCEAQSLPYHIKCPRCGPQCRCTYLQHLRPMSKRTERFVKFAHFFVHARKERMLETLDELGYETGRVER